MAHRTVSEPLQAPGWCRGAYGLLSDAEQKAAGSEVTAAFPRCVRERLSWHVERVTRTEPRRYHAVDGSFPPTWLFFFGTLGGARPNDRAFVPERLLTTALQPLAAVERTGAIDRGCAETQDVREHVV